jgi:hypothetical protein
MIQVIIAVVALASTLSFQSGSRAQMGDGPQADEYPIIAELYNDPAHYAGRSVLIYGLVIEAGPGSTFLLQDVSQHPLRIVTQNRMPSAGDQLMVLGTFHADGERSFLLAKGLIPAQVLAGGGCC